MSSDIGFIILRNVDTIDRNKYWIKCYNCIRKFYPENKILIIDDNSKSKLIRKKTYSLDPSSVQNQNYPFDKFKEVNKL